MRTSINVLGDAYGCGIVEHLSRHELRKLDEEAEYEFAQIISAPKDFSNHQNQIIQDDSILLLNNLNKTLKQSVSVADERKLSLAKIPGSSSVNNQFNEFKTFERQPSNRSQYSFNQNQHQLNQQQFETVLPTLSPPQPPSIVVMDAVRRRSRALLFTPNKIPVGVNSMPQISLYTNSNTNSNLKLTLQSNNNNNNSKSNNTNEDSNV